MLITKKSRMTGHRLMFGWLVVLPIAALASSLSEGYVDYNTDKEYEYKRGMMGSMMGMMGGDYGYDYDYDYDYDSGKGGKGMMGKMMMKGHGKGDPYHPPSSPPLKECNDDSLLSPFKETTLKLLDRHLDIASTVCHVRNGDEILFGSDSDFPYIGNFHKTLPHNEFGEVDPEAFRMLADDCFSEANFTACEAVPRAEGGRGALLNVLGGYYLPAQGLPTWGSTLDPPPPSVVSEELACEYVELAWMAVLRDIPFVTYKDPTNDAVQMAAADLANMPGCQDRELNHLFWRPYGGGAIDPETELFRMDLDGALRGPIVSQFLWRTFTWDAITVVPKMNVQVQGEEFLTTFEDWLKAQNGIRDGPPGPPPRPTPDPEPRYPRTVRDLGRIASSDRITSVYFRAAQILGVFQKADSIYDGGRQRGFATGGLARFIEQLNSSPAGEAHTWFQKWFHRFLRPEAYGGLVHNRLREDAGRREYPLPDSVLNSQAVEEIFQTYGTRLLPQMLPGGGPPHPSLPAGHAVSAGACITVLKVWADPDADRCFRGDIVEATEDGLDLTVLVANNDAPENAANCYTINGELNKLAHNLSMGRDMSGVHWRSDDYYGMTQGEEVAKFYLQDELDRQPECGETYKFKSFDGKFVTLRKKIGCEDYDFSSKEEAAEGQIQLGQGTAAGETAAGETAAGEVAEGATETTDEFVPLTENDW